MTSKYHTSKVNLKELKKLLKNKFIRQSDIARHFGVTRQRINRILKDNKLSTHSH